MDVSPLLSPSVPAEPPESRKNGIGQISLLIVANCAGAGILSLPKAMTQSGLWPGCALIVAAAVISAYTADILGRCYSIVAERSQKRPPDDDGPVGEADAEGQPASFFARSPYAAIGHKAAGVWGAAAVTASQVRIHPFSHRANIWYPDWGSPRPHLPRDWRPVRLAGADSVFCARPFLPDLR